MSGSDLFTGTLDILVLRALRGSALHGYGIGRLLREDSGGVLDVEEGALYPALHRLARRGLIEPEWGKTDTGRRAKFYTLTPEGRRHLAEETSRWRTFSGAVSRILGDA